MMRAPQSAAWPLGRDVASFASLLSSVQAASLVQFTAFIFLAQFSVHLGLEHAGLGVSERARAFLEAAITAGIVMLLVYTRGIRPYIIAAETAHRRLERELSDRAEQAEKLAATLARLDMQKRILDQHAIVSETDTCGFITYANDAFCRASGYAREELVGRRHNIIDSDAHEPQFWLDMYDLLGRGDVWQGEICNRAKDGSDYWVQATHAAVQDAQGNCIGYVGVATDITEGKLRQKRLEDTQSLLLDASARAEAANQAKSEFLATMSHEIRTPLNGVLGMLGLLLEEKLTPEQYRLVGTARESAECLMVIINDVLDYSKLEAGKIKLERISFSPSQLTDGVMSLLSGRASGKGLRMISDLSPDLPAWVIGDPTRLRQILFNLVGNAIKFTEQGSIRLLASHRTLSDGSILLSFEVRDTGIGIPTDARRRLFTRFTQADSSMTRRFGGTGLGLAICKQLTDLMGGEIGVESQPGKGSRFWFSIRVELGSHPVEAEPADVDAYDRLSTRRLRILVADDNHVNQMFVKALLEKRGHAVDVVANGVEAIDALMRAWYDIVLMDVQMPEMDGTTATRRIRALEEPVAAIPIIALTANAMVGQREEYLAAGMDAYVSKPIDPVQLLAAMAQLVTRRTNSAREVEAGTAAEITCDQSDTTARQERAGLGADERLVDDLLRELEVHPVLDAARLDDLGVHIGRGELLAALGEIPLEGRTCVTEFRSALQSGDIKSARRSAHRLKGMAGNFGARRLFMAARCIEEQAREVPCLARMLGALETILTATEREIAALPPAPSNA